MKEENLINPTKSIIEQGILKLIPKNVAAKYTCLPLRMEGEVLHVAMANPDDLHALDEIRSTTKVRAIIPHRSKRDDILEAIDLHYGQMSDVKEIVQEIQTERMKTGQATAMEEEDLEAIAEQAPVIKLVNQFIHQAAQDGASDIHLEPGEKEFRVRYRIDGILQERHVFRKDMESAIIARIKIMSGMDIAERRKPQDGRIDVFMESKQIDIRVSALPTLYGENIVLRLLDKGSVRKPLEEFGMTGRDLKEFRRLIHYPHGILLVTGPTGSGKSTTLYAALNEINSLDLNIVTVEDPIEYNLPLIRQMQVNPKINLTFATGLRSILRQDPDVIMVGEIRDNETADIAVQAALTGHLVLSTLHTNDAAGAVTRLMDMGIPPYLIANSVIGILAQRLVRKICPHCKEPLAVPENVLAEFGIKDRKAAFYHGTGCDKCLKQGFIGRTSIHELFVMTEAIGTEISKHSDLNMIRHMAAHDGMKTLRESGIEKAMHGITTLDEVLEITAQE